MCSHKISIQFLRFFQRSLSITQMSLGSKTRRFKGYDEAIKALSSLDQRSHFVKNASSETKLSPASKLRVMRKMLNIAGIAGDDLERLNVIHIAGTKGKGSTCALVESLIRESSSVKTGFYSSPHLVSTTERIRINGKPISQEKFSEHFWALYEKLERIPDQILVFKFLTLMALDIFIKEKVDVAILEVGIGGAYDCTNVVDKPLVCGITSLGLDHTSTLGSTIEEIAWQKSGICKPGVPVFVDPHQPSDAMAVIVKRSQEIGSPCFTAPTFTDYDWSGSLPKLGLEGRIQEQNAALALQLSQYYLSRKYSQSFTPGNPFKPSESQRQGLKNVSWPGRFQRLSLRPNLTLFLDAAHTSESMEECIHWYSERSASSEKSLQRILIFNATKDHDSASMLRHIIGGKHSFDAVIFCTNVILPSDEVLDNTYPPDVIEKMNHRCLSHMDLWCSLQAEFRREKQERVLVIPYIAHALKWATKGHHELIQPKYAIQQMDIQTLGDCNASPLERAKDHHHLEILVTGSLHLVGDVMDTLNIDI